MTELPTVKDCYEDHRPIRISWSSLRANEQCKQMGHLQRARKQSPQRDIRNFFHGNVADLIMREWLEDEGRQLGSMVDAVEDRIPALRKEYMETEQGVVKWRDAGDQRRVAEFCRTLLKRLEPFLVEYVLPYDFQPELRFRGLELLLPMDQGGKRKVILGGALDILTRHKAGDCGCRLGHHEQDAWVGIDLKATANAAYIRKTLGQARFYDLAVELMTGQPTVDFIFVQPMVESNPIVHANVTDDDRMDIIKRIAKMAEGIWREDWAITKDPNDCYNCSVKGSCIKYQPVPGTTNTAKLF